MPVLEQWWYELGARIGPSLTAASTLIDRLQEKMELRGGPSPETQKRFFQLNSLVEDQKDKLAASAVYFENLSKAVETSSASTRLHAGFVDQLGYAQKRNTAALAPYKMEMKAIGIEEASAAARIKELKAAKATESKEYRNLSDRVLELTVRKADLGEQYKKELVDVPKLKGKMSEAREEYRKTSKSGAEFTSRMKETGIATTETQRKLALYTKEQAKLKEEIEETTEAALPWASGVIGAAIIGSTVALIAKYSQFESQLAHLEIIMGKQAPATMKRLGTNILDLSRKYVTATEDMVTAQKLILQAGFQGAEAQRLLESSALAAAAGFGDVSDTADALTTILRSYGKGADEASRVSDQLFSAVRYGKTDFSELSAQIGRVAPVMAGLTTDTAELITLFAVLARAGQDAAIAATSLGGIARSILLPSVEAQELAYTKYGIRLDATAVKQKGLIATMQELGRVTDADLALMIPQIRGFRALYAIKAQLAQMGVIYNEVLHSEGEAAKALAIRSETLAFKAGEVATAWENLLTRLGESAVRGTPAAMLLDLLAASADAASKGVDEVPSYMKGLTVSMGEAAGAAVTLTLAWQLLKLAVVKAGLWGPAGVAVAVAGAKIAVVGAAIGATIYSVNEAVGSTKEYLDVRAELRSWKDLTDAAKVLGKYGVKVSPFEKWGYEDAEEQLAFARSLLILEGMRESRFAIAAADRIRLWADERGLMKEATESFRVMAEEEEWRNGQAKRFEQWQLAQQPIHQRMYAELIEYGRKNLGVLAALAKSEGTRLTVVSAAVEMAEYLGQVEDDATVIAAARLPIEQKRAELSRQMAEATEHERDILLSVADQWTALLPMAGKRALLARDTAQMEKLSQVSLETMRATADRYSSSKRLELDIAQQMGLLSDSELDLMQRRLDYQDRINAAQTDLYNAEATAQKLRLQLTGEVSAAEREVMVQQLVNADERAASLKETMAQLEALKVLQREAFKWEVSKFGPRELQRGLAPFTFQLGESTLGFIGKNTAKTAEETAAVKTLMLTLPADIAAKQLGGFR